MRRHFYRIAAAAVCVSAVSLSGLHSGTANAAQPAAVDTIVLETEAASLEDVPVDLKWKTSRDSGKWVAGLNVASDVDSLVLVLNDEDPEDYISSASVRTENTGVKKRDLPVNSRLLYFAKNAEGEWTEVFSSTCTISGGEDVAQDELYGIYRAGEAYGIHDNPGSLVSYRKLTDRDYWITDRDSEQYGAIVRTGPKGPQTEEAVLLESMKSISNYGMVLSPEDTEDEESPSLIINCQQDGWAEDTLAGVQLPQNYVRMLIQSIDSNTRIVIAENIIELEDM